MNELLAGRALDISHLSRVSMLSGLVTMVYAISEHVAFGCWTVQGGAVSAPVDSELMP